MTFACITSSTLGERYGRDPLWTDDRIQWVVSGENDLTGKLKGTRYRRFGV